MLLPQPPWLLDSVCRYPCENFRYCDRVERRGLTNHANGIACGPAGQGAGMPRQRVRAPHRGALLRFLSRVATSWSIRLSAIFYCPRPSEHCRIPMCCDRFNAISKISLTY
jgi:hypothetical protein